MASLPGARAPHDANSPFPEFESLFLEDILACPACGADLTGSSRFETYGICGNCQRHFPLPARERLRLLVDDGSFHETNAVLVSLEPLVFRDLLPMPDRQEGTRSLLRRDDPRGDRAAEAAERGALSGSGVGEAVLTGTGTIGGHAAVLIVLDHAYLGASIGPVAGEKILLAMEAAAQRRLPLVAICTAGGARSPEGLLGLLQAPEFAAAAAQMHRTGVPFVSVLAHPATGAVWSALPDQADIILAGPGARVGPGRRPADAESAESLLAGGMHFPSFPTWKATKPWFWDRDHFALVQYARETPPRMARLLGVPAVHPSHVGDFVMETMLVPGLAWPSLCVGETAICDADGVVLDRLSYEDGEGWICADVDMDAEPRPRDPMPPGFWNSLLPISVHAVWHAGNVHGRVKYEGMKRLRLHSWQR